MPNCRVALLRTHRLFFIVAVLSLWMGACTPHFRPRQICPGKATRAEAIATLQARLDRARPLSISGVRATMGYLDDRNVRRKSGLSGVKIFLEPPHNVYMQAQATLIGRGGLVSMGSNEEEFWLSIKPDSNSYWWGKWSEVNGTERLQISPQVVLEALGMLDLGQPESWFLRPDGGYDVLTLVDERGTISRQLVIDTCDYLPRKIKYFDSSGELLVLVELGDYEAVVGDFEIPTRIEISNFAGQELSDWLTLTFVGKGIRGKEYTERFRQRYFTRTEPRGYDKVHRVTRHGIVREQ